MNSIKFHTRWKYGYVTGQHIITPLSYAARAIHYCCEYDFLLMQDPPDSSSRAVLAQADFNVPDAEMFDKASKLPWLELHTCDVRAGSNFAQAIRAVDRHDFF